MTQQLFIKSKTAAWYMTENANQLLWSEAFDNALWYPTNVTVTIGQTDPSAGTTASRLTATLADATFFQQVELAEEQTRVFSIYVKRITGTGNISLTADGVTYEVITPTGAWVRYDTPAAVSGVTNIGIKFAVGTDAIDVAFAQLEDGSAPTAYRTNGINRFSITQVTDPDYPVNTVRGSAFLDAFFFVMTPSGVVYQSGLLDAATWSALEFIQSQNDPGKGVFLSKINNYIVAFKDYSTEFFYNAGNPVGSVLSPVMNAAIQIGCASDGSVQDMNGALVFMGQSRLGFGRSVYMLNGTSPQKISTPDIEKIINTDSLATVYSWVAQVGAHALYGLTLVERGVTLVYDLNTQLWSFFTILTSTGVVMQVELISAAGVVTLTEHGLTDGTIIKMSGASTDFDGWHVVTLVTDDTFTIQATGVADVGAGVLEVFSETYFPVVASVRANGRQYMQDATSGAMYELDALTYADYVGAIAARIRSPKLDDETANKKTLGQVELIGDKIQSVALIRTSDDDYATYSSFRPINLGANRSRVRRMGNFNRRAFEVLHVKSELLRLSALELP